MAKQHTLGKKERLKSRKRIEQLFREGRNFSLPSFRVCFLRNESSPAELQFGIGVSSRFFKKATDRNRIKRLCREAWRLQKMELQTRLNNSLQVFVIFTGKEVPAYDDVFDKTKKILKKLLEQLPS